MSRCPEKLMTRRQTSPARKDDSILESEYLAYDICHSEARGYRARNLLFARQTADSSPMNLASE
jgi:hypothetical protein